MKKILATIFLALSALLATSQTVLIIDHSGYEHRLSYGSTKVYVEVDGEWMPTYLYHDKCPYCHHYYGCVHRDGCRWWYWIPTSYAYVSHSWYFNRPYHRPSYYHHTYYRYHKPAHVHHPHVAPAPKHHHDSYRHEPPRSSQPRSTVNTRSSHQAPHSARPTAKSSTQVRPQSSTTRSSSVRTSSPSQRPSSSSSTRSGGTRSTVSTRR